MSAIVALLVDGEGSPAAIRFPSYDDLHAWEDKHPEVFIQNAARLVSRSEALADARSQRAEGR